MEALPHLAAKLAEATKQMPQFRVLSKAISDRSGETEFTWVKGDEGFSGIRERQMPAELAHDIAVIRIKRTILDRAGRQRKWFFRRRLSFIKMDVEGGDITR